MLSRNIARAAGIAALQGSSQDQQHRQLRVLQEEEEVEVGDYPDDEVQRVRIDYVGTVTVTNCIFQVSYDETAVFYHVRIFFAHTLSIRLCCDQIRMVLQYQIK